MIKPRAQSPPATLPAAHETPSEGSADPKGSGQGSDLAAAIGDELKSLFDAIATEPVPDRFRQLLDELERKAGARQSSAVAPGDGGNPPSALKRYPR